MNLTQKINLYFFNPRKPFKDYRDYYLDINPKRFDEEGLIRYSPLFFLHKDIRHCLLLGKKFNSLDRNEVREALFPAILLMRIGFAENVYHVFTLPNTVSMKGKERVLKEFAKRYMGINEGKYLLALNQLRNAITHSNYTLSNYVYEKRDKEGEVKVKYFYSLGHYEDIITEYTEFQTTYPARLFKVNPKKLYTSFYRAMEKIKENLLDNQDGLLREHFDQKVRLKHWVLI